MSDKLLDLTVKVNAAGLKVMKGGRVWFVIKDAWYVITPVH